MASLKGKVALVTGSTSGIGEGIARAFAKEGAHLVLNGFGKAEEIESLRKEIETTHGIKAIYNAADLSKPAEIEAMMQQAQKELGGVDILVNNAGIQFVAPIEQFPVEKWDAIIAINLSSSFHTIRLGIEAMKTKKWGRIINIASAHGLVASSQKAAYVAAKHGIVGLTKVVGLEAAGTGVTCNAICPGWVLTPLVQKQIDDNAAKEKIDGDKAKAELLKEKQPSGEFVTVEQIGGLAVFLCSDAADQITGTSLSIDGGWTAQ